MRSFIRFLQSSFTSSTHNLDTHSGVTS